MTDGSRRRGRPRSRLIIRLVVVALAIVACSGEPGATSFVPRPDLIRMDKVDVVLVDPLGLTEGIAPVPSELGGPFQNGIETVPGDPHAVIVP